MKLLSELPFNHALRTSPLSVINAKYRNTFNPKSVWREVLPSFGIASYCYNELADCWTSNAQWTTDGLMDELWDEASSLAIADATHLMSRGKCP